MPVIKISMPLLTHLPCTDNVKAKNKYWKINNQAIYNGSVNTFQRAIIVNNMHRYIINALPEEVLNLKLERIENIHYIFHTVRNHGSITRRKDNICWKPPVINYKSTWDLNNISDFWIKTGNDSLTLAGVIIDDNTDVIFRTKYEMIIVDNIDDLELEIIINY